MKKEFDSRPNIITPVMEERVIKVAYQDGSLLDRLIVHHVRKQNHKVEALFQQHLNCVRETRIAAARIRCPASLSFKLEKVADEFPQSSTLKFRNRNLWMGLQGLSAAALVFVMSFLIFHSPKESHVNQQELEEATLQAKNSLALISEIMNGTSESVKDKVIMKQTAMPIHESIFKGTETIKNNI